MKRAEITGEAVRTYLERSASSTVCGLEIWYVGLGGEGVPDAGELAAIERAASGTPGWESAGVKHYEIYGDQHSFKRTQLPA